MFYETVIIILNRQELIATLPKITTKSQEGCVFRFVALRFQKSLLSAVGSLKNGGRYNISEQFEALYTSGNPITALKELKFLVNTPSGIVAYPSEPVILLSLKYRLQSIIDLTNINNQNLLNTNLQELTGDWLRINLQNQIAPTQELAQAAYNSNTIEALKVPSAADSEVNTYNLVIFLDRLDNNSYIEVYDPTNTINLK
ncbi:MAG: RES domain-containing protein [Crocosphaera sp.]